MKSLNPRKLSQLLFYRFFSLYQFSLYLEDVETNFFARNMMNEIRPWIKSGLLFSSTQKELGEMNLSATLIDAIKEIKISRDIEYIIDYKKKIPLWIQELIRPDYLDIQELKQIISNNGFSNKEELLLYIQKEEFQSSNKDLFLRILTYTNPEYFPYEFSHIYDELDPIISAYQGELVRGIIHNHTIYSDGILTIQSLIDEARKYGYEYIGISDHSSSTMLGIEIVNLQIQREEINKQRKKNPNFAIFHGIECEILKNGELDFSDEILSLFDYVIVGIHTHYDMNKEKATQRLIKAVSNPYCDILAHPECRILDSKPGLVIDIKKVIDACVENFVIIEINGNHKRLDLDPKYINYAINKGAYFELASDVHENDDFKKINNCILIAEKYSIPKERIINFFDSDELYSFFKLLHNKKRNKSHEL